MSILAWIVLGLIAGYRAGLQVDPRGEDIMPDVLRGVAGSLAGGFLFEELGTSGQAGLNHYSLLVSAAGAAAVLLFHHVIRLWRV